MRQRGEWIAPEIEARRRRRVERTIAVCWVVFVAAACSTIWFGIKSLNDKQSEDHDTTTYGWEWGER